MKQITFKQYKAIDISILSVLLVVFEALAVYASGHWFSHYGMAFVPIISLTPLIVLVMIMRWDAFAFIPAILGGAAYCFGAGGNYKQYIVYCLGNLFGLLSIFVIRKIGKNEVRTNMVNLIITSASTYLFMTVGRWLVSLVFVFKLETILGFMTTDIVSLVVLVVGMIALRKSDGMIEDQKSYLLRLDRERREEEERKIKSATSIYCGDDEYDDEYSDEFDDEYSGEEDLQSPNEINDELI